MATQVLMQAATMLTAASGRLDGLHHPSAVDRATLGATLTAAADTGTRGYASRSQVGDLARRLHSRGGETDRGNRVA